MSEPIPLRLAMPHPQFTWGYIPLRAQVVKQEAQWFHTKKEALACAKENLSLFPRYAIAKAYNAAP